MEGPVTVLIELFRSCEEGSQCEKGPQRFSSPVFYGGGALYGRRTGDEPLSVFGKDILWLPA